MIDRTHPMYDRPVPYTRTRCARPGCDSEVAVLTDTLLYADPDILAGQAAGLLRAGWMIVGLHDDQPIAICPYRHDKPTR